MRSGRFRSGGGRWRCAGELADRRGIAGCLERLALGLAASDQFEAAAWLFGAAEAQRNVLGLGLRHDVETDHAHLVAVIRQSLGGAFTSTWEDRAGHARRRRRDAGVGSGNRVFSRAADADAAQ